jgi:hypothetical protein
MLPTFTGTACSFFRSFSERVISFRCSANFAQDFTPGIVGQNSRQREQIMIDFASETLISLKDLAKRLPPFRPGRPLTVATLTRWCRVGVRGPNNSRIKLEAVKIGGAFSSSEQAFQRFLDAQAQGAEHLPAPRSPASRRRAIERAAKYLESVGI